LPNPADGELLNVLDNVPPPNATRLTIPGGGASAWLSNGKMYLRTRFVLLSPGYLSVMKSPDGTYAYELQKTPSILVSQYGKPVELRVQGV
jgi:intracellular multiplication protein IcmK